MGLAKPMHILLEFYWSSLVLATPGSGAKPQFYDICPFLAIRGESNIDHIRDLFDSGYA